MLANDVFNDRLFHEVREKRGLVYEADSSLDADRDRGTLRIAFRATLPKVDAADAVVRAELKRMQTERIGPDELVTAKTDVIAAAIVAEEATGQIADDLLGIGTDQLPATYYTTLAQRYGRITAADVQRVAKTYLHPDNLIEVRTGPAK